MNEMCGCVCHISGVILTGENKEVREKPIPLPLLFAKNPKRTGLGSNPGLPGETSTAIC
jgi:hypothetical protein